MTAPTPEDDEDEDTETCHHGIPYDEACDECWDEADEED